MRGDATSAILGSHDIFGRADISGHPTVLARRRRRLHRRRAEYLIAAKVIRPGVVTLMEMVGTARKAATDLTHETVADLLTEQVCSDLDRMLMDVGRGMTPLVCLTTPAVEATAKSVKAAIEKPRQLLGPDWDS